MNVLDEQQDTRIREALKRADASGNLPAVAAVTGIAGGERELRKIMNSHGALPVMDRAMLAVHLA